MGPFTKDCDMLAPNKCLRYSNCGVCVNEQKHDVKCLAGDIEGPFFTKDCGRWIHNDYYKGQMFGNPDSDNIKAVLPWSHNYQWYEIVYPSPIARATL